MLSLKQSITIGFVATTIALYFLFPTQNSMESFTALIFLLIILPLLYIKIILHQSLGYQTTDSAPAFQWQDIVRIIGGFLGLIVFLFVLSKSGLVTKFLDQPLVQNLSIWQVLLFNVFAIFPIILLFSFFVYKLLAHILHFLPQRLYYIMLFSIFVLLALPLQTVLLVSLPFWVLLLPFFPLLVLRMSFMIRQWYLVPLLLIGAMVIVYKLIIISF